MTVIEALKQSGNGLLKFRKMSATIIARYYRYALQNPETAKEQGVCSGWYGRSMLSHPLCSHRNHVKNPTCPFNQELELLAMQRSQSQTAVYSNAAPGPVIHSST